MGETKGNWSLGLSRQPALGVQDPPKLSAGFSKSTDVLKARRVKVCKVQTKPLKKRSNSKHNLEVLRRQNLECTAREGGGVPMKSHQVIS